MSDLILPASCRLTPVQLTGKERVCVLVHADTGRILCFCLDDRFTDRYANAGYRKIEINHAHEYDMWARRLRQQAAVENQAEDAAYLEREHSTRKKLRSQLIARRNEVTSGAERQSIDSALHTLEVLEKRRMRYRKETFMAQEAFEVTKNPGDELVEKIMVPKA